MIDSPSFRMISFAKRGRELPVVGRLWAERRRRQFVREYRRRRDTYATEARSRGLVYDADRSTADARARVGNRAHVISPRESGSVHTLAFVPRISWHAVLLDELAALGPLSAFDYTQSGVSWLQLYEGDVRSRRRISDEFVSYAQDAHRQRAVDWVFVYASGVELVPDAVSRIQETIGAPIVGMCLDDKNSWVGPARAGVRAGQRDLAAVLDLAWTSSRVTTDWYLVEGGRPVYLPEGCSPSTFAPSDLRPDLDVTFVGECYGFRPRFIAELRRAGIDVHAFGRGWPNGPVSVERYRELLSRSRINLGLGGNGYAPEITNVKGHDFEIPCAGGGVYLTTFNSDLAQHFDVGREILCFRDLDEAVELCRYYLSHPDEAREIAARGRERCLREHTWRARFDWVLAHLGILACAA